MNKMMIDITKKYQTRDGLPVTLISDKGRDVVGDRLVGQGRNIIGYVGDSDFLTFWYGNGQCQVSTEHDHDLIEVKPKRTFWLNLYQYNSAGCPHAFTYKSREHADDSAMSGRIACIEIEFEEGEGL